MSAVSFSLIDNQTFTSADISNGLLYTSPEQNNATGTTYPSLKLIADYIDLQSTDGAASVTCLVEAKSDTGNDWYPLGYQFDAFSAVGFQQRNTVVIQPDLLWFDAGISNVIWVQGVGAIAMTSNQQASLAPTWRACIHIYNPNNSFTSLKMSLYGERYGA